MNSTPCDVAIPEEEIALITYDDVTVDQNNALLCGHISTIKVGNGWTGSVNNLGVDVIIKSNNGASATIPVVLGTTCFNIPSYNGVTSTDASANFIKAYNLALNQLIYSIHASEIEDTTSSNLRSELTLLINANLQAYRAGSAFSTGPCLGSIPVTNAPYCNYN
ncbi:hypothetical protein [Mucilaginibacter polytrichastri]|uniref:hypothetical protein n=1 Tax=Mucilaginibacter polytrichastri TaxID=1302689 RepID=UPI000942A641|nr:hypothetical protein [Mucilaginibacter polytrichastri]